MLEVRQQVRLSFPRLLDICLDSVAHRMLRSTITVLIVLLAIAFLSSIMLDGYMGRSTRDAVQSRADRLSSYSIFLRKASEVGTDESLVRFSAQVSPASADFTNLSGWGALSLDDTVAFIAQSRTAMLFLRFFDTIPMGRRVLLVERYEGGAVLDWLCDTQNRDAFMTRLAGMRSIHMPAGVAVFEALIAAWPAYREQLAQVKRGYGETVRNVSTYCGPAGIGGKLSEALAAEAADGFFNAISERGLCVDPAAIPEIVAGRRHQEDLNWAYDQLRKTTIRTGWYRKFSERFSPGRALASCATAPSRIEWIEATLRNADTNERLDTQRFQAVAVAHQEHQDLLDKEQQLADRYGSEESLSSKTIWLMCVSFLVCVVGISNAMLMSVLERFKEIATMKCLGARNGTIAFLFVTESAIIGIAGGAVGIIAGFVLVLGRLGAQFGGFAVEGFPVREILTALAVCFGCSLVLTTVAAIYPAWVASRMAPMEAMRVD